MAQVSSSLYTSVHGICSARSSALPRLPLTNFAGFRTAFSTGSPIVTWKASQVRSYAAASKAIPISIRSEQTSNGLDVWLGRSAMIGFAVAISVEIATGKGLLENFGLTGPLPIVALSVTALVGVLTAVFIFQSSSKS
ncbi:stress enhanced protein 1, chloroplastic [Impatiens glandulifera]|uniref:stress enhanced protein 1, chloroplastic n=1 Tax=Impatiens glandulifera TaxID=253017 RepID=UPI001FB13A7C|nr:stress enhanced protein 1, chloroplastic [Impatiens glandulifera]